MNIGEMDTTKSNLKEGLFVTDKGYTSRWFSATRLTAAIQKNMPNVTPVWGPKAIGGDMYVLLEKN